MKNHRLRMSGLILCLATLLLACQAATAAPSPRSPSPTLQSKAVPSATIVSPLTATRNSQTVTPPRTRAAIPATRATIALSSAFQPPNLDNLRQVMLDAINADRAAAGLSRVQLDALSTRAGQAHAEDMSKNHYFSHWDLQGWGPDLRYGFWGGTEVVMENIFTSYSRYSTGTPVPVDSFERLVREAETSLMNSPGHRVNILRPEHTHVGIGIAYNSATGDFHVAQEFVNRYVELDAISPTAVLGETLTLSGRFGLDTSDPLINLAYEPIPRPMSIAELNATRTYSSTAKFVSAVRATPDAQGRFRVAIPLERGGVAGIYHIRLWVKWKGGEIQAVDAVVTVETGNK